MAATPSKDRALEIIEHIERIGFPNKENIATLKKLVADLVAMTPFFTHGDLIAIKQIDKMIHKIDARIQEDGEIPIKMYTQLNKPLFVLKVALRALS